MGKVIDSVVVSRGADRKGNLVGLQIAGKNLGKVGMRRCSRNGGRKTYSLERNDLLSLDDA